LAENFKLQEFHFQTSVLSFPAASPQALEERVEPTTLNIT